MPVPIANALVLGATIYAALGLLFAVAWVTRGVSRLDPAAEEGTRSFRVMILPGSAALWPLLLARWLRGAGPPVESNDHRARAVSSITPEAKP